MVDIEREVRIDPGERNIRCLPQTNKDRERALNASKQSVGDQHPICQFVKKFQDPGFEIPREDKSRGSAPSEDWTSFRNNFAVTTAGGVSQDYPPDTDSAVAGVKEYIRRELGKENGPVLVGGRRFDIDELLKNEIAGNNNRELTAHNIIVTPVADGKVFKGYIVTIITLAPPTNTQAGVYLSGLTEDPSLYNKPRSLNFQTSDGKNGYRLLRIFDQPAYEQNPNNVESFRYKLERQTFIDPNGAQSAPKQR